jgi:hypothetical protein
MLADGDDCLADLRAVRDQQPLFGPVASDATAFRVIDALARDEGLLSALRVARARARTNAWELGAAPERVVIDIDATLITAHSEKQGAAGTLKRGFGFHPLLAFLDESREALAGLLRPGNAGANTAADHIEMVALALAQLPGELVTDAEIIVRTDSAAATHPFTDDLAEANVRFLMGFDLTETVRAAILGLPGRAWRPAIRQDGQRRDGTSVAEITSALDLSGWPAGTRVLVRRERPHPGAQLSFTNHDGHRFQATLTDLQGDSVELERLHRGRANGEDRIRAAKQTGLENLPFQGFDHNAVWLELSLIAQDLTVWTQALALTGELAVCEPKTLRYPAVAHRRPARLPRPPLHPPARVHLALGRRLHPPGRAPTTSRLIPPRARPATTTRAAPPRSPLPATRPTPATSPSTRAPAPRRPPQPPRARRHDKPNAIADTHIRALLHDPG